MSRLSQLMLVLALSLVSAEGFAQSAPPAAPPPPKGKLGDPIIKSRTWEDLVLPAANFKIALPGKPQKQEQKLNSQVGELKLHVYTLEAMPYAYLVMHTDYPISIDSPTAAKNALDGAREAMMARPDTTLVSEQNLSYGLYSGREIVVKTTNMAMFMRLFVVQNRLYNLSLMVLGGAGERKELNEDASRFWDSFKLLEVPKAPDNVGKMSEIGAGVKEPPPGFFDKPAAWQALTVPELGFQVSIPSQPFKQVVPLSPAAPELKVTMWLAKADDLVGLIYHQAMAGPPHNEAQAGIMLKSLMEGLTESTQLTVLEEKPASLDGHPGKHYKLKINEAAGLGKAFVVGKNIYCVLAFSGSNPTDMQGINKILNSLKLIPIPDKAK